MAANARHIDPHGDRIIRTELLRGTTDCDHRVAILLLISGQFMGQWHAFGPHCPTGEHDYVATLAVAVEVERNLRAGGDMREPVRAGSVVYQETVVLPEKPDRVGLRCAVRTDR